MFDVRIEPHWLIGRDATPSVDLQVLLRLLARVQQHTLFVEGRQTGHGFRHLLSTELNGRGYNKDWIERQLAHGDNDEIRATYNHAAYLEQRREMMQAWADSIDALCAGANVVSIKRKA